jgi:hypothetical protein
MPATSTATKIKSKKLNGSLPINYSIIRSLTAILQQQLSFGSQICAKKLFKTRAKTAVQLKNPSQATFARHTSVPSALKMECRNSPGSDILDRRLSLSPAIASLK